MGLTEKLNRFWYGSRLSHVIVIFVPIYLFFLILTLQFISHHLISINGFILQFRNRNQGFAEKNKYQAIKQL